MELFLTDLDALDLPVPLFSDEESHFTMTALIGEAKAAVHEQSIPTGMPFFLDQEGSYESLLNEFFLQLPSAGCRSPETWIGYARDISVFGRFLEIRCDGKHLFGATKGDFAAYHRARRLLKQDITARSWNRAIAALDRAFNWALEKKVIQHLPFDYKTVTMRRHGSAPAGTVSRNNLLERVGAREEVKCVSLESYLFFRDVGLLGRLPDGTHDPSFRGRNALRNAAYSELSVTAGVRLSEGSLLLKAEFPDINSLDNVDVKICKMALAATIAKLSKGRNIYVPKRVIKDYIVPYIKEDRANAVISAATTGRYELLANPLLVKEWHSTYCRLHSPSKKNKVAFSTISKSDRYRLITVDGKGAMTEPGLLWCNENGMPTHPVNFEAIFKRACERCSRFGVHVEITPHTLRHTFAVNMLSQLIKASIGDVLTLRSSRRTLGESTYRRIVFDPFDRLRRLLGHSSIESTYIYLTYLEEAQELVDEALNGWSERLGPPSDLIA